MSFDKVAKLWKLFKIANIISQFWLILSYMYDNKLLDKICKQQLYYHRDFAY